ncbi:MAG TPA: DUF3810 family protein, partial [Puia sp.]|nr:DUF3810 family protein [Puia sp.]
MRTKRKIAWICLITLAVVIKVFSRWPEAVEKYYSTGLYPVLSRIQRSLFGWIPFSIGDLLYGAILIGAIYSLVIIIRRLIKKQADLPWFMGFLRRIVFIVLLIYVLFNGLWGLNYDRKGIASQLQLNVQPYTTPELTELVKQISTRLNETDSLARLHRTALTSSRYLYSNA